MDLTAKYLICLRLYRLLCFFNLIEIILISALRLPSEVWNFACRAHHRFLSCPYLERHLLRPSVFLPTALHLSSHSHLHRDCDGHGQIIASAAAPFAPPAGKLTIYTLHTATGYFLSRYFKAHFRVTHGHLVQFLILSLTSCP